MLLSSLTIVSLTGRSTLEVVVVLRHVGEDAQPVRDPQRHHVLCVQQRRDAQLLLGHSESLDAAETRPAQPPAGNRSSQNTHWHSLDAGMCPATAACVKMSHNVNNTRNRGAAACSSAPVSSERGSVKNRELPVRWRLSSTTHRDIYNVLMSRCFSKKLTENL